MIDFFGPGYDAVEAMGVLPRLRELAYEVTEAAYLDETGRRRVGVSYDQFARAVGGRVMSIMRPDLEQGLREQLRERVELRYATTLTQIDQHTRGIWVSTPPRSCSTPPSSVLRSGTGSA
jgi:2-polyprenyl-6-methoxyphenol hydroxylase-like FAD-dependent oxidoreductase